MGPYSQRYPNIHIKSSFLYLWFPRGHGEQWTVQNHTTLILLYCQQAAVGGSRSQPSFLTHPLPCNPPRCPTAGMSVVPLVLLSRSLRAWLALPSPSRWLLQTIRLCHSFRPASPQVQGHPAHLSKGWQCLYLALPQRIPSLRHEHRLRAPKVLDQSRAFLPAALVGAKAPSTHKVYAAVISAYYAP